MTKPKYNTLTIELPRRWRWIARDEDGAVCVFTKKAKAVRAYGRWCVPCGEELRCKELPPGTIHLPGLPWTETLRRIGSTGEDER